MIVVFCLLSYDFTRGNNMPSFVLRVKAGSMDLLNCMRNKIKSLEMISKYIILFEK